MSRYIKPTDYNGNDESDRQAMIGWQDAELSSESARLDMEDDRPTDSQARAAGGVEAWYKQRDEWYRERGLIRPDATMEGH
jgi:hypothetical protein|tara:strand:- start:679 stop:921 length:243 start_codon:yes stop_codon:yes gene_type:complete